MLILLKVHVTDLKNGDCLITDTFNSLGLHVLPKGTVVEREEITILMRHKIDYVDIEARLLSRDGKDADLNHGLNEDFDLAIQNYESIFMEALAQGSFSPSMVDGTLRPLLETLDAQKMWFLCCSSLTGTILTLINTLCWSGCCLIILLPGLAIPKRNGT